MTTKPTNTPTASETAISKTSKITVEVANTKLTGTVAPCCWMYPGYPFQVSVTLGEKGGNMQVLDKSLTFATATYGDMERMVKTVQVQNCKCEGCNNPAFVQQSNLTNRDGACEGCFTAALNREFEQGQAKEAAELAKLDAEQKSKGCTHRIDAWIHRNAGDDSMISFWMKNPTKKQVQDEIKKLGSCVLDDYSLIAL